MANNFVATQAKRELIFTKTALMAPSGGGKTYSALRLATGMIEKLKELNAEIGNGKILLANTESSRGRYYANEFQYDIVDVAAPHSPEMYVDLINWAVEQKYPILIIDSSTHEWEGKGGCLELHQQAGGTFQSWAKITPRHDKFIQAIADSPIHIIATMRGKDQYEIEKNDAGKANVKKLGVGAQQRQGFEYEFTVTFLIDQKSNMATCEKDNTHLFEDEGEVLLSETFGKKLISWANSGEGYTPPVRNTSSTSSVTESGEGLDEIRTKIITICSELGGAKNETLMALLKGYERSGNPNKVKDFGKLQELLGKLEEMKGKE
jgi:hypothetical protein